MNIIIREMSKPDSAKCKELTIQLGYPEAIADFDKRFSLIKKLPHHHLVVAESKIEKEIVGLMHLEIRYLLEAAFKVQVSAIVVDGSVRGKGVGKKLLIYAENWAKSCGFNEVFLYSNIIRAEAHAFYEKNGYTNSKDSKVFSKALERNLNINAKITP